MRWGSARAYGEAVARREGQRMRQSWWKVTIGLLVMLMLSMSVAACGGDDDEDGGSSGGNDNDKMKARMESFINHLNKQDTKGLISDLPPDSRKDCKEEDVQKLFDVLKGLSITFKLADFKPRPIEGNNATADIKIESTAFGKSDTTDDTQKFVKVGNEWYFDTEGKPCADALD
jgi:hypothetical protein